MALMTMESLFKKVNLSYKDLEIDHFYDISEKNLKIKSKNKDTNQIEYKKVLGLYYKGTFPIWNLVTKSGTCLLRCNENHRVFDVRKNDYVSVNDFEEFFVNDEAGNEIHCFSKKTKEIDHIVDLSVENNENYFSNGIESHNSGGEAPKFYASTVNRTTKTDVIKDGNDVIGIELRVRNYKNKAGIPFRDANMKLYYKGGFKPDEEYIQFLVDLDIISQKGAYFTVPGEAKSIQGRDKLQTWLFDHPDVYTEMKKKVDEALTGTTKLDLNNTIEEEDIDITKIDEIIEDDTEETEN